MQATHTQDRDPIVFRQHLRQEQNRGRLDSSYYALAPAIETYLWQRETALLFQMGDAVEVLKRSLAFCVALLEYQKKIVLGRHGSTTTPPSPAVTATLIQLEEWSFSFCWDLKRAAQAYLQQYTLSQQQQQQLQPKGTPSSRHPLQHHISA
eukprot:CAMPEP_0172470216 /NCGR_PEP_ID=MMETSP1065-20121228/65768_1 /TAXON_ID=265537 /ORGANISM="Amphiprora paludosa, Strain CCMP125" /LENGTH=150 /DNA_ID=CAMNT_0013228083 /DNA_START=17 /DNA_END=465 /DNA_ORIENTATION=-